MGKPRRFCELRRPHPRPFNDPESELSVSAPGAPSLHGQELFLLDSRWHLPECLAHNGNGNRKAALTVLGFGPVSFRWTRIRVTNRSGVYLHCPHGMLVLWHVLATSCVEFSYVVGHFPKKFCFSCSCFRLSYIGRFGLLPLLCAVRISRKMKMFQTNLKEAMGSSGWCGMLRFPAGHHNGVNLENCRKKRKDTRCDKICRRRRHRPPPPLLLLLLLQLRNCTLSMFFVLSNSFFFQLLKDQWKKTRKQKMCIVWPWKTKREISEIALGSAGRAAHTARIWLRANSRSHDRSFSATRNYSPCTNTQT